MASHKTSRALDQENSISIVAKGWNGKVTKSGWGVSVTCSGHAMICQYYANTQAIEQHISYPLLRFSRVMLLFLLVGFGFGIEYLILGLRMGLRFVLY